MLIRLRKEDGSVVRLEVSEIATVGELRDEILRRGLSNNLDLVLSRDARGSDPTARLEDASAMLSAYGLHHGDMVYIAREDWVCGEMQQGGTWTGTAVEEADAAALEAPPPRLVGGSQRGSSPRRAARAVGAKGSGRSARDDGGFSGVAGCAAAGAQVAGRLALLAVCHGSYRLRRVPVVFGARARLADALRHSVRYRCRRQRSGEGGHHLRAAAAGRPRRLSARRGRCGRHGGGR
eukprot:ctg_368.g266